jgi:hypothetical protein
MHTATAREIAYQCIEDAQKFSTGAEHRYSDDKTVVVIKRMRQNVVIEKQHSISE